VRITHLSKYDITGGAGLAAYRLHTGLRSLGHDSRMLVYDKESTDPSVIGFVPPFDWRTRLRRGLSRRLIERSQEALESRPAGAGYFSDDRSQHGGDALRQALPTDVLHLHWIANFIDYSGFFRRLPRELPVLWTLHDMNPFTGGCHHAAQCQNFLTCCGDCPQLSSPSSRDFSSRVWRRKRRAFGRLNPNRFRVIAPSRWLAGQAKRSSLMGSFSISVIPNGLDTESFRPRDKFKARQELGIPPHDKVLLFVAQWLEDRFKGMPTLLQAMERLRVIPNLRLLTVGRGELANCPVPHTSLGSVSDEERMSLSYGAADLFLLPSAAENFPNGALEALACGLPVVASNVGGVPEIVREGCTGRLVEVGNAEALADATREMLGSSDQLRDMSVNCRRVAVEEYDLDIQAGSYADLYASLLEARANVRRAHDADTFHDG
jgi:glycosyltransferase involved in cell wall biosynthesis